MLGQNPSARADVHVPERAGARLAALARMLAAVLAAVQYPDMMPKLRADTGAIKFVLRWAAALLCKFVLTRAALPVCKCRCANRPASRRTDMLLGLQAYQYAGHLPCGQ